MSNLNRLKEKYRQKFIPSNTSEVIHEPIHLLNNLFINRNISSSINNNRNYYINDDKNEKSRQTSNLDNHEKNIYIMTFQNTNNNNLLGKNQTSCKITKITEIEVFFRRK